VENRNNHILRLSISAFIAIILHSAIALTFTVFNLLKDTSIRKTVPVLLLSADRKTSIESQRKLSAAENSQAAKDYLTSLSKSNHRIQNSPTKNNEPSKQTQTRRPNLPNIGASKFSQNSSAKQTIFGLQDIFSKQKERKKQSTKKQVSTKSAALLSDYELQLLTKLAKDELYDPFHDVMNSYSRGEVEYIITLNLFTNGAIKSAHLKSSSGIDAIDKLAVQTAYRASPYPTPPKKDIEKNFKYDIPIIYQTNKLEKP
jgi:TonB family protein